jgi:4-diphosphocytidyl-2-C-methyl-D-erythritol kinase
MTFVVNRSGNAVSGRADAAVANACAKINLTLEVLGQRDDEFHELRSLVIGIDLHDSIHCSVTPQPGLVLQCSNPILSGTDNLGARAAAELARHCGLDPALRIELQKAIPVGAGLGGGSSDAATTLRICNHLWEAGLGREDLSRIGARLGSDVAFFFSLPSAVITGRGEQVEPVILSWSGWVLLVLAGPVVPTVDVYRAWRKSDSAGLPEGTDPAACQASTAEELNALLFNHLEPAVFRVSPTVARIYHQLQRSEPGPWRVSGAGSALFRLFDAKEPAIKLARVIEHLGIRVTTTVVGAPIGESPVVSKED